MKAKPYQINALIPRLQKEFKAALIFGTDTSGVLEIAKQIQNIVIPKAGPFSVISLTPVNLKENPDCVLEEANTPDLMGGRRLIWLKDSSATHADVMSNFIDKCKTDSFLLMTSDNLTKSSALRAESESNPNILVIACYPPETADLKRIVNDFSKSAGFDFSSEAIDYLIQNTENNSLILKNELNKIALWNSDKKQITLNLMQKLVGTGTVSTDTLIQNIANRQVDKMIFALNALLSQGENPVTLVRSIARYFSNLLKGCDKLDHGESTSEVVKKILKPTQFMLEDSVKEQLHTWSKAALLIAHHSLLNAEIQMKSGISNPELILKQTLLTLTRK